MIYDRLENMRAYMGISNILDKAIAYMLESDLDCLDVGKTEVDAQNIFINRMEYETGTAEERIWEAHRDYLDIHYILSGEEIVQTADINTMDIKTAYNDQEDFQLFDGLQEQSMQLEKGRVLVCFPQDVHKTGVKVGAPCSVQKIVCKVRIDR